MTISDEALGTGARFVKLLQTLAEGETEFSLKELSARLGLPTSTVHRLLQLMVSHDMVERSGDQGYRLGRELYRISSLILRKFDVPQTARPMLEALFSEYQETVCLCLYMPATRTGMVVDSIRTPHPLRFVVEPFTHLGLIWGSLGRSILAYLPKEDAEAVLATANPGPISQRPPPSTARLRQEMERIRKLGYALYEDRNYPDVGGIAAPAFDHSGKVMGSIGVIMPGQRFELLDKARLGARVAEEAARLSTALGFGEPPRGRPRP